MIDEETKSKIRTLFYGSHYTVHAICKSLGIHHTTVKRHLNFAQTNPPSIERRSILDSFKPLIDEHLELYPRIPASRLNQILADRGYKGSVITLRRYLKMRRPKKKEAFLRMRVHPGEQAQVDWAHCGEISVGKAKRKLYVFVMVLSYSRAIYAEFTFNMKTSTFLRCHEKAFEYFGGIPRVILYDNLKSVVLARQGKAVRFNPEALEFSGFYHFEPRACNVYRGNEKGRVERAVRYIRDNFLAARNINDIKTANEALSKWCNTIANQRPWPDNRQVLVSNMWQKEKQNLMNLPTNRMEPKEQVSLRSGKTPWVTFDLNSYSIPPSYVGKPLILQASEEMVSIFHEDKILCEHPRSFDRGQFFEIREHREELIQHKQFGRTGFFKDNLIEDFPLVEVILSHQFDDGFDIPTIVRRLYQIRYAYGDALFSGALERAINSSCYSIESIRSILTLMEREDESLPSVAVSLPNREDVKNLQIPKRDLSEYDDL